jgi:uncharacterized protein (DUF488 family)
MTSAEDNRRSGEGAGEREPVFTIGHSHHPFSVFLELLQQHHIEVVVDTRSHPASRYAAQYDALALQVALEEAGIGYVFLGDSLGGRPSEAEFYDNKGYVLYENLAQSERFTQGIAELKQRLAAHRVALLCSEENPDVCHRKLLIGRALAGQGYTLRHIRGSGAVESDTPVQNSAQPGLFEEDEIERAWKSAQSVLPKRARKRSSPR